MSAKLMGAIWDYVFDLEGVDPRTAREVLLVLANHMNKKSLAWPSVATIAREISIDGAGPKRAGNSWPRERAVRRTIDALRKRGVLVKMREAGFHQPVTYRIVLTALSKKGDALMTPIGKALSEKKGDALMTPIDDETKGVMEAQKGVMEAQKGDALMTPEPPVEPPSESGTARSREQDAKDAAAEVERLDAQLRANGFDGVTRLQPITAARNGDGRGAQAPSDLHEHIWQPHHRYAAREVCVAGCSVMRPALAASATR